MYGERVLNMASNAKQAFQLGVADPVITPQPYASPADFAAQYPTPLDPNEVIAMCSEVTLLGVIPDEETALKEHTWRELNTLAFTSGSSAISFADGECPSEYTHDGNNTTVVLKNIGAKKSLSFSDLKHSAAVAGNFRGVGINRLVAPLGAFEGLPGTSGNSGIDPGFVMDVKAKEIELAMVLTLNGEDRLLVNGDHQNNSLDYTGIENWQTAYSCSFHTNDNSASGTFSSTTFDRFLGESCADPTHIFGHPTAIQEMMSSYFQLGFQGSQIVNFQTGNQIVPGYNYASLVNTGNGQKTVVADSNFARTDMGNGAFQADLWTMRMVHDGIPLVVRKTQFPLGMTDLVPGCTAISFQVWKKTSLVIKHCCAHGQYTSQFTGRVVTTCPVI